MAKVHNCSECDYCYSNDTMGELYLCVNGNSEYLGEFVDGLGMAEDDMDCVIINGKDHNELVEEMENGDEKESITLTYD